MNMVSFSHRLKSFGVFTLSDVLRTYACARRFFARLASEIFLSSLPIALMVGLLVLSGCIYMGRDFVTTPVKSIENNVTTQREIFGYFGEPIRKGLENGYETWTYSYQYYELAQLRDSKELYVVFNKDNTVRSYSFSAR